MKGSSASLVFQALRHLGQKGATPKVIRRLRSQLSMKERAGWKRNLRYAAAWMKPIMEQIAREENG